MQGRGRKESLASAGQRLKVSGTPQSLDKEV
jgi:hypothetical protein